MEDVKPVSSAQVRALAYEMHGFLQERYNARPKDEPTDEVTADFDKESVRLYQERFELRARACASAFRAADADATAAVFFKHVDRGPENEHDVFHICNRLVRVLNHTSLK